MAVSSFDTFLAHRVVLFCILLEEIPQLHDIRFLPLRHTLESTCQHFMQEHWARSQNNQMSSRLDSVSEILVKALTFGNPGFILRKMGILPAQSLSGDC